MCTETESNDAIISASDSKCTSLYQDFFGAADAVSTLSRFLVVSERFYALKTYLEF